MMKSVTHLWGIVVLLTTLLTVMSLSQPAFSFPRDRVAGNMMLINDNAGWCWYQDDKIIYDPAVGNIITSTSGCDYGFGGATGETRSNDVDATTFNIDTGKRTRVLMAERGGDDHNMGGLWIRPDGRYLHLYCPHYTNPPTTYFRLATNPNDGSAWGTESNFNWQTISGISGGTLTYTNVHYMSGEGTGSGRLYDIVRWNSTTPNIAYSDDLGVNWQYMGRLNSPVGGATYSNYYHKFRSNGVDRIDFIGVEQHPRNYNNSVFHGYIKGGKGYDSFGNVIDDNLYDQDAPSIEAYTPIFIADQTQGPGTYHTGWTNEIELDKNGYPVCMFQTRYGDQVWGDGSGQNNIGAADHRFFYGRFNGTSWSYTELCKMGTALHHQEQDYEGMGCIHPDDANLIYVSTNFDPVTDVNVGHREIFKGVTYDNGLTWNWTQITFDSTVDNIRPAIPPWNANNTAVFWERGDFPTQGHFDMVMVGMVEEQDVTLGLVSYIDASTGNTTNADGSAFSPTGPSGSPGAVDNLWHAYTGYGNGGSCYTAGDSGTENVPTIKTTITGLSDGTYDVFAYFWSDPNADWGIRGGFTSASSDMLCFNKQSSQFAEASQFSGSITNLGSGVALYRIYIGRKVVSGGTPIVVYLDNYDSTYSTNAPTRTTYDGVGVAGVSFVEDTVPPEPDPMTWATMPTATGPMTITMTATTATDDSPPVQYYFECTTDDNANSNWQTNPTYVASGLTPSTIYSFRVMARDSSLAQNETGWSSIQSATTNPPDTTPPTPDPMTWLTMPTATGPYSITMTASTATDTCSPPVQYYFECTNNGSKSSGWQTSATYSPSGLNPSTLYSFRVRARDSYLTPNVTGWSSIQSATTLPPPTNIEILGSWATGLTHTKESGTNRALIFIAHGEHSANINLTGVTYGGQAMTKVTERIVSSGTTTYYAYVAAYILDEAGVAAASSSTFVPTWNTTPESASYASVFLSNVNQTTSIGATASNSSTGTDPIATDPLATNNGDMVIDAVTCGNGGSYTMTANGFTEGTDQNVGGTYGHTGATGYKSATGAAETPSADFQGTVNRQVIIGFVVKAGAAADLPPAAPTGLTATPGNEMVSLNWNDNGETDLDGYNVYRSTTQGSGYGKLNVSLVSDSNYIDNTVTNGIPYYYVVTAVDVNGHESDYSNEATATPWYQTCAELQAGGAGLESDLTGDCYVNYLDLEIIVNHWLNTDCTEPDNCGGADFEPTDSVVDLYDFSDFAEQWLLCNNPKDPDCIP
jgi:hypothetical protein